MTEASQRNGGKKKKGPKFIGLSCRFNSFSKSDSIEKKTERLSDVKTFLLRSEETIEATAVV